MTAAYQNELGLGTQWQRFTSSGLSEIRQWQAETTKAIFELSRDDELFYIADEKRASGRQGSRKDQLWEFPGGRIDPHEDALSALLRELSEEDSSGVLHEVASRTLQEATQGTVASSVYYRNIRLKTGEPHTLFRFAMSESEWQRLSLYWRNPARINPEIYGFALLGLQNLDTRYQETRERWTPKSRKILQALRQ